jgi:hypothetical protein
VFYALHGKSVVIERILHGHRDIDAGDFNFDADP